jgi:hypothetical protein
MLAYRDHCLLELAIQLYLVPNVSNGPGLSTAIWENLETLDKSRDRMMWYLHLSGLC